MINVKCNISTVKCIATVALAWEIVKLRFLLVVYRFVLLLHAHLTIIYCVIIANAVNIAVNYDTNLSLFIPIYIRLVTLASWNRIS